MFINLSLSFLSMVAGTPAKVLGYIVDEQDPSMTMNHDATKIFFKRVAVAFRNARSTGPSVTENKEGK
ncbi:hypothetical protein Pint_28641 [Pistacia integerrima]|uniref:Uncharacterized protein n=1 Tax=Pistacia integerrima TaxID=434235 RepID=A0ACC0YU89_9ROSI|nr:hypothetical protein Pint_28641 [Pistacia integerrima]